MSRAWIVCAWAYVLLVARVAPAPAPPLHTHVKESKVQDKSIVVRRMPNAYFYPFSLWPLPKFPDRDAKESNENFRYRRDLDNFHKRSLALQAKLNKR